MTILALDRLQIADWSSTTHQIRNCSSSSRHAKRLGTSLCLNSLKGSGRAQNIKRSLEDGLDIEIYRSGLNHSRGASSRIPSDHGDC